MDTLQLKMRLRVTNHMSKGQFHPLELRAVLEGECDPIVELVDFVWAKDRVERWEQHIKRLPTAGSLPLTLYICHD